jgi:hypothetical protein
METGYMQRTNNNTRMGEYQESKALSEIKGKMILARQFPRSVDLALERALTECNRRELAEQAQYEFPRGDSVVRGPSIRLVEVLARAWGNLDFGVDEIEARDGSTTIKAYCWDLETNVSDEKTFTVPHVRTTKKQSYELTDSRDIYEAVANQGARRKRACILAVLPGWFVDAAVETCNKTLENAMKGDGQSIESRVKNMVGKFETFGITGEQIAAKAGKPLDKLNAQDLVKLSRLYSAINDGFVKPSAAFGEEEAKDTRLPGDEEAARLDALNSGLSAAMGKASAAEDEAGPLPWDVKEDAQNGIDG